MRGLAPPWVYQALLGLGIVLLIYQLYKVIIKWRANSLSVWVNIIHVFFVAPLLIYIGKNAYDTPRWAFELLAMLSFSALGYHVYQFVLAVQRLEVRGNDTVVKQKGGYASGNGNGNGITNQEHPSQPFA